MAQKLWQDDKDDGSKISNTEWGIVIGILWVVDGIQIGLDLLFQIGVIINRFIDILVGLAWSTYLYLRGVNLKNVKTIGSILLTFFAEEIPDMDALPFWGADGLFVLSITKAEELAAKNPMVGKALKNAEGAAVAAAAVAAAPETGGASLAAGGAAEGAVAGAEAGAVAEEAGGAAVAEGGEAAAAEGETEVPEAARENEEEGGDEEKNRDDKNGTAEDNDVRKKQFLEQLKQTPDIDTACQKTGINRETFDRWQKEDQRFANDVQRIIGGAERQDGNGRRDYRGSSFGGSGGGMGGGGFGAGSGGRGRSGGGRGLSGYRGSGRRGRSGIAAVDNLLDLSSGYRGGESDSSEDRPDSGIPQAENLLDLSLSYGARKKKREGK